MEVISGRTFSAIIFRKSPKKNFWFNANNIYKKVLLTKKLLDLGKETEQLNFKNASAVEVIQMPQN